MIKAISPLWNKKREKKGNDVEDNGLNGYNTIEASLSGKTLFTLLSREKGRKRGRKEEKENEIEREKG